MAKQRMRIGRRKSGAIKVASLGIAAVFALGVGLASYQTASLNREANWEFTDTQGSAVQTGEVIVAESADGARYAANTVLLCFDGSISEQSLRQRLGELGVEVDQATLVSDRLDGNDVLVKVQYSGTEDPEALSAMLATEEFIGLAEPDYIYELEDTGLTDDALGEDAAAMAQLETTVDDPYLSKQWAIDALNLPSAWDKARCNGGVTIAVMDSGVQYDHPDLAANLVDASYAYDAVNGTTGVEAVEDGNGHGTHVVGILSASTNNALGVAGVSYNAKVLPVRVTSNSGSSLSTSNVVKGINYLLDMRENSGIAEFENIRVINMSFGGSKISESFNQAIQNAVAAGITVVAAAGNDHSSDAHYPSDYDNVISVSGLKSENGTLVFDSSYSNYGNCVDISAPGTTICSTALNGLYGTRRGTSMAAPMVSGVAALVYALDMSQTPAEVEAILESTATDLGEAGKDQYYGYGALNAMAAVGAAYGDGECGENLHWTLDANGTLTISGTGAMRAFAWGNAPWYGERSKIKKVVIEEGATTVSATAFCDCANLTQVSLPDSLESIGAEAFCGCTALGKITIPASVATIGDYAFKGCSALASVSFEGAPSSIGESAFYGVVCTASYLQPLAQWASLAKQYGGTITWNPVKVDVSTLQVSLQGNWEYTGRDICPKPVLTYAGTALREGVDYTLSYQNNRNAGEALVSIVGTGAYTGEKTLGFTIEAAELVADPGMQQQSIMRHCTQDPAVISVELTVAGIRLSEGTDYRIAYRELGEEGQEWSYDAPISAGEYTAWAQGMGNYTGELQVGTITLLASPQVKTDGTPYHLCSAANSAFVLDVAEVEPTCGANVSVWDDNGGANQLFTFELTSRGTYVIRNVANPTLVLDAADAQPECGANVSTWTDNGGLNQQWLFVAVGDAWRIVSAANTQLCLDAAGSKPVRGANVSLWNCNSGLNQQWVFQDAMDISRASLVVSGQQRMYTGSALGADVSVSLYGKALAEGDDYQLLYDGQAEVPTEVGSYQLTVKALDPYVGLLDAGTFTIYSPAPVAAGVPYHVVSAADASFVLDVAEAHPTCGANVSVWDENGGANQMFTFELGSDGYYVMRNVENPSLVLDAEGAKPVRGANVSTWTANGGLNQRWLIIENGDGRYTIASAYDPDFVLDAAGSRPVRGANVSVWTANGGLNQLWEFSDAADVSKAQVSAGGMQRMCTGSGLAAEVSVTLNGKALAEGADYQVLYNGQAAKPVDAGSYAVSVQGIGGYHGTKLVGTMTIYEGPALNLEGVHYHIRSAADASFVLDVAEVNPTCGANVSVWDENGGANQMFSFELGADGYYVIRNAANTSLVLDAANAQPECGANVSTWTANDGLNQRWIFVPVGDTWRIVSAANTQLCLDAAGAAPARGANVSIWTSNSGLNQRWTFSKYDGEDGGDIVLG